MASPRFEKQKAPRGTQDILPEDSRIRQLIEYTALQVFSSAGFDEISTPIFESTNLFSRAVGEDTDIVHKEMYTFKDRSDRSLTLRPEGTAGLVRSFIENAMDRAAKPVKLWYRGPMFRYERPQAGRYRQFTQIGVEAFGIKPPYIDLEVINLAWMILENLGFENLTLYINSLGTRETRQNYKAVLKEFLKPLQSKVCDDCKRRYEENPLRALDCKVPEDKELYKNAPDILGSLDSSSKKIWEETKSGLEALDIKYKVDPKLVRGLDYYDHFVFEIKANDPVLGQQSTVLAGGRYDHLVEDLGSKPCPAVGWALGIERLVLLIKERAKNLGTEKEPKYGIYIVSDDVLESSKLAMEIRDSFAFSVPVNYDFEAAKISKQIEKALKQNARFVIFYLEEERKNGKFKLKDLDLEKEFGDLDLDQLYEKIEELASQT